MEKNGKGRGAPKGRSASAVPSSESQHCYKCPNIWGLRRDAETVSRRDINRQTEGMAKALRFQTALPLTARQPLSGELRPTWQSEGSLQIWFRGRRQDRQLMNSSQYTVAVRLSLTPTGSGRGRSIGF